MTRQRRPELNRRNRAVCERLESSPRSGHGLHTWALRSRQLRSIGSCLLAMMVLSSATACSDDETITWELSWSDDFEGAEGSLPDPANWRFDVGEDWGNAQLEYDTDRATNVSLDGTGNLRITAREESYQGRSYTSGRINSLELFDQAYGRFEARVRLPIGAGVWPAFWLLGANFLEVGWPDCGEIDVMEYRGQEPFLLHGSLHGPGYSGGSAVTSRYESGTSLDSDFHVYAIEWTPESISWYFDDALYQIVTPRDLPSGGRWVFDHPFFVILNVAVGGHFVGPPNDQTIFPQTMLVDYVRVYREKSG